MTREFHKWYSPRLGRDMEMLIFGHGGMPILVFPTSLGRFFEYEDNGMIGAVWQKIEEGKLQFFCIDSVDGESWYNRRAHAYWKVRRHEQYEEYVLHEVLPLIRSVNPQRRLCLTGCSFGGYHAVNFTLRHPDVVDLCVSMGGAFDIKQFTHGYYDNEIYFNNPPDFLPNQNDPWFLEQYRRGMKFILATGEWDICLGENFRLANIMGSKGIPHWLDVWGDHSKHDWPWWRQMAQKYFY